MLSVPEMIQNGSLFNHLDFRAEFRIDNQLSCFDIHSIRQIFMGENVSIKRAINEKMPLQWLLDIGENHQEDFHEIASLSLCWKSKENECYIGNLWIEPDFRGNGLATFIFNEIINYADELGIVLTLHALPFVSPKQKPTSDDVSRLVDYYYQFGFKRRANSNGINFKRRMIRFPQERSKKLRKNPIKVIRLSETQFDQCSIEKRALVSK